MPTAIPAPDGPHGSDPSRANAARLYDVFLGGKDNYLVDRVAADNLLNDFPLTREVAQYNRAFGQRAVRYMVNAGIDQFLDIGSGFPTMGNVHQIAQAINPAARVVYSDYDRETVNKGRMILQDNDLATEIFADFTKPEAILKDPEVLRLLDFDRPIGLTMFSMLHFVSTATNPYRIVEEYKEALAPGSVLVLSHGSYDGATPEMRIQMTNMHSTYVTNVAENTYLRSVAEISTFFYRWDLVDPPGIVLMPDWYPDDPGYVPDEHDNARRFMFGGAAVKPEPV